MARGSLHGSASRETNCFVVSVVQNPVNHFHEQFVNPLVMQSGDDLPPTAPGYSITLKPESISGFAFPNGPAWR